MLRIPHRLGLMILVLITPLSILPSYSQESPASPENAAKASASDPALRAELLARALGFKGTQLIFKN